MNRYQQKHAKAFRLVIEEMNGDCIISAPFPSYESAERMFCQLIHSSIKPYKPIRLRVAVLTHDGVREIEITDRCEEYFIDSETGYTQWVVIFAYDYDNPKGAYYKP